ncbi:MAG: site-2 protease family protein [Nitrosopumilus sp.]|nr:site-2 protease family protein [Nitrosopumilus sp.]
MKGSLFLGRISGIKIFIHWTFLILIFWIIGSGVARGLDTIAILWYLAFVMAIFACVVLHELGHALTAKQYHIPTKDITLLPIGGLARFEKLPEEPKKELIIAIAGPIVNFVIAGIIYIFWNKVSFSPEELQVITPDNFIFMFMSINLFIGLFNLIPAFPMDGGRILRAALSFKMDRVKATGIASKIGQVLAIGFVFLGFFANIFLILIGIFVYLGARAEAEHVQSQSLLKNYFVRDVIITDYYKLHPDDTIETAIQMMLSSQAKDFLVIDAHNAVAGTLSRNQIIKALAEAGKNTPVAGAMDKEVVTLNPEQPLEEFYTKIRQYRDKLFPVMENGNLIGVLDADNIMEFLMVRQATKSFET